MFLSLADSTMWSDDAIICISINGLVSSLGSESVLLDADAGRYWGLDPISSRIWELIQSPTPFAVIIATLLDEYDVPPERCRQEVRAVLQEMEGAGLIDIRHDGADDD